MNFEPAELYLINVGFVNDVFFSEFEQSSGLALTCIFFVNRV